VGGVPVGGAVGDDTIAVGVDVVVVADCNNNNQ